MDVKLLLSLHPETLAVDARLGLHAHVLHGRKDHRKAQALFKALDPRRESVPSAKGV